MDDIKRVLVTGATGYIGRNLVRRLIQDQYEVTALVRATTQTACLDGTDGLQIRTWDGSTDSMLGIFEKASPQAVLHLASLFLVRHQPQDIVRLIESNLTLGTVLLEACQTFGVTCFVNTSTHWKHYNLADYDPVNLYAATKKSFEDILLYYNKARGIRAVTLSLIDTYGPFDPRGKIMSLFKRIAQSGETLSMSPGGQELGLVYIDDVVNAFLLALKSAQTAASYQEFIAAPPKIYTLKEVAGIFEQASGQKLRINWGGSPYRERDMMYAWTKEKNILKNQHPLDLPQGIERLLKIESGNGEC